MKGTKGVAIFAGAAIVAYHALAVVKDFDRVQMNYRRWEANGSYENLVKLLLAEGILVKDAAWLL